MSIKNRSIVFRASGILMLLILLITPLRDTLASTLSGTLADISATITDLSGNPLSGLPYTNGETYTIDKVAATYHANAEAAEAFTKETGIPAYCWDVSDFDSCKAGIENIESDNRGHKNTERNQVKHKIERTGHHNKSLSG